MVSTRRVLRRFGYLFEERGHYVQVDFDGYVGVDQVIELRILGGGVVKRSITWGVNGLVGPFIYGVYIRDVRGDSFVIGGRVKVVHRAIERLVLAFGGIGFAIICAGVFS